MYNFSDNAFGSHVFQRDLDRPLFSVAKARRLLFYDFDIYVLSFTTPEIIAQINDNMNRVADLLEKKGIGLIFMPVVSKYDLYSEFITGNPYPKSTFFEALRPLPKKYTFIDTKSPLLEEVRRGEKDIFFADDTHWTWKASDRVFSGFRIPEADGRGGLSPRGDGVNRNRPAENRPHYGQRTR
jgi:hypothetical protein